MSPAPEIMVPGGAHGRILPNLEQANLYNAVKLNVAWEFQQAVSGLKTPVFACPSNPKSDVIRDPGGGKALLYPTSYGFNFGTWFVFNPATRQGGDGMFYPNSSLSFRNVTDGTSNTLLISEVKTWQHDNRNGGPGSTAVPAHIVAAEIEVTTATDFKNTGHTEWPDGRVHQQGFTTTLTPNSVVNDTSGDNTVDCDFNSWQEGHNGSTGNPTYAFITSRSYHAGIVQVALVDGSCRSISENIDLNIWRALGTRGLGEEVGEFSFTRATAGSHVRPRRLFGDVLFAAVESHAARRAAQS